MRLKFAIGLFIFLANNVFCQIVSLNPAFDDGGEMTLTFDANLGNGELKGASKIYVHLGVVLDSPSGTAWKNVIGHWGQDDGVGLMQAVAGKSNVWKITITPNLKSYFNVAQNNVIYRLACVFRNADGSIKGTFPVGKYAWGDVAANQDYFINIASNDFVRLISPATTEVFVSTNEIIPIQAVTSSQAKSIELYVNDGSGLNLVASKDNVDNIESAYTVERSTELYIKCVARFDAHVDSLETTTSIVVQKENEVSPVPDGLSLGVNYEESDPTKATLVLLAPQKNYVHVIGDMNDWKPSDEYQMKVSPDGLRYWLQLNNLDVGKPYVYQYLIDGKIKIADPYTHQVADPWNDSSIPTDIFPNLPSYSKIENGVASVLQTNQKAFEWANSESAWVKPNINHLVVYELHLRDFLASHSFSDLKDTLSYLKRLGIQAIELMPINEFEGNDSWGYNPSFYFAVDKYYGTKDALKSFIQAAHVEGIAVIMDIVLNHAYGQCPLVRMYYDGTTNKPSANNPWFNREYVGQYQWGYDFNHESIYTQNFVDDVTRFWLKEFHFDGYRFDFTKGFTNYAPGGSVDGYDASRINILNRITSSIRSHTPDAYIILEHWAPASEEASLAANGMKMWRNKTYDMVQAASGQNGGSFNDMNSTSHFPLISSHDEQRLAVQCFVQGKSLEDYNIKDTLIMMERIKMAAAFTYLQPGPKMIWQFDELGYDIDIDFNGRLGRKPRPWGTGSLGYYNEKQRQYIYETYSAILRLRETVSPTVLASAKMNHKLSGTDRRLVFDMDDYDLVLVGNFGIQSTTTTSPFTSQGIWYDYITGDSIDVSSTTTQLTLKAGEWHIYTSKKLSEGNPDLVKVYSNPVKVSPFPFKAGQKIVIQFDASKSDPKGTKGLLNANKVYMQAGVIFRNQAHPTLQNIKGNNSDDGVGQMTKINQNIWEITLTPSQYFGLHGDEEISKIGMWFRNEDNTLLGYGFRGSIIYVNVSSDEPIVSISPSDFNSSTPITITFNADQGNGELINAEKVYIHSSAGVKETETPQSNAWSNVIGNWGEDDGLGLMKKVQGYTNKWQITLTPKSYYNLSDTEFPFWIAAVFRNADGSKKGTTEPGELISGFVSDNLDYYLRNTFRDSIPTGENKLLAPNPTSNELFILGLMEASEYFILDPNGSIVSHSMLQTFQGIDVSGLQNGVYYLVFKTQDKWESRSFLKQ
ncbi:MAG: DUF4961 domain-containing protein [Saprospiraceae bacterium]